MLSCWRVLGQPPGGCRDGSDVTGNSSDVRISSSDVTQLFNNVTEKKTKNKKAAGILLKYLDISFTIGSWN